MLLFSFAAFVATSLWFSPGSRHREDNLRRLVSYQFADVLRAYETGGPSGAQEALKRLDRELPGRHYLLDRDGRDVVTGEDRSALLTAPRRRFPFPPLRHMLFRQTTAGGKYTLAIQGEIESGPWSDVAVYGWIVLVIVLLCYALAWTIARPLGELRQGVLGFGRGDFSFRARSRRKDELGDLARAFDLMADRTETLLTAERRLLQDVSHELRSPLARLRFALELARSGPSPEAFARVQKEVDRLAALVGELLQVTRAEGDPGARNNAPVDLQSLLESLAEDCRIESEARGCSIRVSAPEKIVWEGDGDLLHRAVENVLRNAVRHTPPGSTVDLFLTREGDDIAVRVRDYGPGVPEPDLERIFRPFYRVEEDRNREGGGVGLGLAIAQRAVRLHHGEIRAVNTNPGLMVEMRLPR